MMARPRCTESDECNRRAGHHSRDCPIPIRAMSRDGDIDMLPVLGVGWGNVSTVALRDVQVSRERDENIARCWLTINAESVIARHLEQQCLSSIDLVMG